MIFGSVVKLLNTGTPVVIIHTSCSYYIYCESLTRLLVCGYREMTMYLSVYMKVVQD